MRRGGRTELPEPKLDWDIIKSLVPFLAAYKGRTALAVGLLITAKASTVAVPMVLKSIVDNLDVDASDVVLLVPVTLLIAYGGLRLANTVFRELQATVFARVRHGIMRRISAEVITHLHRLSLRYHLERKTGEVARDIGRGTSSVSSLLNYLLFNIVPTLVEVSLVAAVLLTNYSAWFVIVTVITVILYGFFTFIVTQWRMKFRTEMNRRDSEANSRAIDGLLNYETVKYFNNEKYEIDRYDGSLNEWEDMAIRVQGSLSFLNAGQGLLIAIGVTITMFLAAQGVVDEDMTIGDLVAVNAYLLQLFVPLGFLGTIYSMLRHALSDMERMFMLLEEEPEIQDREGARTLDVDDAGVRFDRVSFHYSPDRPILHDVTIEIPAGERVAIVGASGSGKSTLARLLYRFYDVQKGTVLVEGHDVRDLTQHSLRSAIGIVPQDTVLFNDTLQFNLQYGRLEATQEEIDEAIQLAQLGPFIESLPDGLETVVGERGLKLSGGEKQRVAIARALLKDPPIMIFDEATSSLDTETEKAIVEAMRTLARQRTTMVIAHRLSTIVDSDKIVVLDKGRVVEEGTHQDLLAAEGRYAELWRMQQQDEQSGEEVGFDRDAGEVDNDADQR